MHASGTGYNGIAQHFREIQEPTARGGKWAAATVRRIALSESARSLAA